ncbi:EVE domain-containing protein [Pseudomonas sp.]|uniref:EVE domain-containing protein n=1 Tax=Pseudomonas sp. TaxID=306 RepID=UPI002623D076|nr:EVE domain-containing protein [Pseudomonas sp.]
MAHWLMKSEPEELSIKDFQRLGETRWDGVRNYQARNFMRAMAPDDTFFFYHSSCAQPGIVGIGRIVQAAYPDPSALDPGGAYFDAKSSEQKNRWSAVNVSFVEAFPQVLKISFLKQQSALEKLPLVQKGTRLSVMPVTAEQWQAILALR